MNHSTTPAPYEAPAPLPGCPYERVRLGTALRYRDAIRLMFLTVATALLAMACGSAPESSPAPAPADPTANVCYVQTEGTTEHINCTDPTPDVKAVEHCVEVGTGIDDLCTQLLAGAACSQTDIDSWQCQINK